MLDWYFQETVWLGTAPGTRAENFYKSMGRLKIGNMVPKKKNFEMTYETYKSYYGNNFKMFANYNV